MKISFVKTHWLLKFLFPKYIWELPNNDNKVYLTFDDGPTPEVTQWTLNLLKEYNAKATFFCIGENIKKHPEIFKKVIEAGHSIGNHTFNHLNGWETTVKDYLENVKKCKSQIPNQQSAINNLFRPPFGKIKPSQSRIIRKLGYKIIMWDVISYDFNTTVSKEKCLENVLKNVKSGSIIVFHDSVKAFKNLEYILPKTLEFLKEKKLDCERIS
jgi:peptidoglycan/xylan/chitin deacetylase (PgdA/CDA1 family)